MFGISKAALLPLVPLLLAAGVQLSHAQAPQPPTKAPEPLLTRRQDPADPKATIPASVYRSSLNRYQIYAEPDVAPWRETNELVRQRGGWRAYAREAREPVPTPSSAVPAASQPASGAKPAMPGHAGHEMK